MVFRALFERFVDSAPVCVMYRALLENIFSSERLNTVFHQAAVKQYERELMFSTMVDITSLVVTRCAKSVHAAYVDQRARIPVSIKALYDKLDSGEKGSVIEGMFEQQFSA